MDDFSRYFVGAYATSPTLFNWDSKKESEFIEAIKSLNPIRGLELPFWGKDVHEYDSDLFLGLLDKNWEYVLTCLPGNMKALELNPHFGLASDDENGRESAVEYYRKASTVVSKINSFFGAKKVISVAIAASPGLKHEGVSSSAESLEKSLKDIIEFDWSGAKLVIEHCDSGRAAHPVKGFMNIEEEIEAILKTNKNSSVDFGLTINWARSVLEYRSTKGVIEHIRKAKNSGLLCGLMFSGTSDKNSNYGVWSDLHLPVAKEKNISYYEVTSLMTKSSIMDCLKEARYKELDYMGVKLLVMPVATASMLKRVGVNRDAMQILNEAISEINLI